MGFFDLFSGKDDTPPAPETRVIPKFAENIENPIKGWITTQVFIDKKNKKRRVYYAARLEDQMWKICLYSYSVSTPQTGALKTEIETETNKEDTGNAILFISQLDKTLMNLADNFSPVSGLSGNYREAANLHGAYFDDKGNYISIAKDKPLVKDATFNRKGIQAMYSKAADKSTEAVIGTWDDFYREIVNTYPQAIIAYNNYPKGIVAYDISNGLSSQCVESSKLLLKKLDAFDKTMTDNKASLQEKQSIIKAISYYGGGPIVNPAVVGYTHYVTKLTALLRAGGKLYHELLTSISGPTETIQLLSDIADTIGATVAHHENLLAVSPEHVKQLINIMMQGPDPYADKPLPLEVFLDKYKDQVFAPTPKKTKPKPPSAG
jgi:hypothetical protein